MTAFKIFVIIFKVISKFYISLINSVYSHLHHLFEFNSREQFHYNYRSENEVIVLSLLSQSYLLAFSKFYCSGNDHVSRFMQAGVYRFTEMNAPCYILLQ